MRRRLRVKSKREVDVRDDVVTELDVIRLIHEPGLPASDDLRSPDAIRSVDFQACPRHTIVSNLEQLRVLVGLVPGVPGLNQVVSPWS
ncbi:hypothetical protein FIBSPDRAFT_871235 [Athelia psychrophila]|uniref:Uncharacterized protein n=1 Tax=Athelia psychrophila TaxID=1759441 RepID=A0A166AEP4_9AGAM|nr:hypothetical protein FIBSPDRAFT_871235 [Fibularhizoctonia sp. CBS 109695]